MARGEANDEDTLPRPNHVMQRGLREIRRRDRCLSNVYLDLAVAGDSLCLDPRLIPAERMSRPRSAPACSTAIRMSFSISLLRTISLESACEALTTVSTSSSLDRRADCGGRRGRKTFLVQARVEFVELLHLAVRAPAVIAVPRVA